MPGSRLTWKADRGRRTRAQQRQVRQQLLARHRARRKRSSSRRRPSQDEFRRTGANMSLWRSSSSVEFHPAPAVTARWDALSLRDLRDYGTITPDRHCRGA